MKSGWRCGGWLLLFLLAGATAQAANTDGYVTFAVTNYNYTASYSPNNVAVVWLVDASGKFVKTLCRHAASRIQYLYKWNTDRGSYTNVDGVSGATISSQPTLHAVTWNCRGTNGAVMADGTYYMRVEYTSANNQGPYTTNYCVFTKGPAAWATNYPNLAAGSGGRFGGMKLTFTPYANLGITAMAPNSGITGTNLTVQVTVSNKTVNAMPTSVTLTLSNVTSGAAVDVAKTVTGLAGGRATNVTFAWSTAGLTAGVYRLRAQLSLLPSETNTIDNLMTNSVTLSTPTAGDIAVTSFTPTNGFAGFAIPLRVRVTNLMATATGGFNVTVTNLTSGLLVGTQPAALAGRGVTNLAFNWNTAGLAPGTYHLVARAGPVSNETSLADNVWSNNVALAAPVHDVAAGAILVSAIVPPDRVTNVTVVVTNPGDYGEALVARLVDLSATPPVLLTNSVSSLAAYAATNLVFAWNTTHAVAGYHTLQADVVPVPGETHTANNTNHLTVIVAAGLETNVLVSRGAAWKYYDAGLDISAAPWVLPADGYYDGFWSSGHAPLGYGLPGITTTVGDGGVATNRHRTTYFRREFTVDFPALSIAGRVRRVDGLVLYLNGEEIDRHNMPGAAGDPVGYATQALAGVTGPEATNYFAFAVTPSNAVAGRNIVAAEVHLAAPTNSGLAFDLELTAINPVFEKQASVAPLALAADGEVQPGDLLGVTMTLTNQGNVAAASTVLLIDAATGAVIATQEVATLVAGETLDLRLAIPTLGLTTGGWVLQAIVICNGVTNLVDVATAAVTNVPLDFSAQAVNAAGSIGGRCQAVAAQGTHAYLGCGAALEIWDLAVPAAPVRVGSLRLPGRIEDLAAAAGWVFAAAGAAGVQVVNVADPASPVHVATFDTSGFARRLALSGGLLYVADGVGGVQILDVAAPDTPVLAGAYHVGGVAQDLALTAPYLQVLDGHIGLHVLMAASPAELSVSGLCAQVTAGTALAAIPGTAWVGDANGRLFRIASANPAAPTVATNVWLPAFSRALAVSSDGGALYAAAGAAGLLTLQATTLAGTATHQAAGGEALDVAVAGDTLLVAQGFAGCQVLDITAPLAPTLVGTLATGARPVDAAAAGPVVFVAADEAGFQVYSLTNPAQPALLAASLVSSNARGVAVSGDLAFVADGLHGLKIFNVSNPAAPVPVGSHADTNLVQVSRVAVCGPRVAITDGRRVQLLDVAHPAAPAVLASFVPTNGAFVFDLALTTSHVFAACGGGGLQILGLAALDPAGHHPGYAAGVAIRSNLAVVANGGGGWLTLDIANPAAISLVQSNAGQGAVLSLAGAGPLVYLANGQRGVQAMSNAVPLTPVAGPAFPALAGALRVRAMGGLALVAEDNAGLAILNASPNDINLNGIADDWEQQHVVAADTTGVYRTIWDVPAGGLGANGYTFYQSYLAGLDPQDPGSVLAVGGAAAGGPEKFVVRWTSVPGVSYTLYKSTDLRAGVEGFSPVVTVVATSSLCIITDTVNHVTAYYTVVVP